MLRVEATRHDAVSLVADLASRLDDARRRRVGQCAVNVDRRAVDVTPLQGNKLTPSGADDGS